jgi:hypothetical protein
MLLPNDICSEPARVWSEGCSAFRTVRAEEGVLRKFREGESARANEDFKPN